MNRRTIACAVALMAGCIGPGTSVEWPTEFDQDHVAFLVFSNQAGSLEFEGPFTADERLTRRFDDRDTVSLVLVSVPGLSRVAPRFDGVAAALRLQPATPESVDAMCRDEGVASDDGLRVERALAALVPAGAARRYRFDANNAFVEEDNPLTPLSVSHRVRPCLDGRRLQLRSWVGPSADLAPLSVRRLHYLDDQTIVVLGRAGLAIWEFGGEAALQSFDLASVLPPVPESDEWLADDFAVDSSQWPAGPARVLVAVNIHEGFEADGELRFGHRESRVLEFDITRDGIEFSTTRSSDRRQTLGQRAEGKLQAISWLDDGGYLAVGRQRVESATSAASAPVLLDVPGMNARTLRPHDDPSEPFMFGDDGPVVAFGDPRRGAEGIRTELVSALLSGGVDAIERSPRTGVFYAGTSAARLSRRDGVDAWTEIPYRAGPEAQACFEARRCGRYEPIGSQGTLPIRALGAVERAEETLLVSHPSHCTAVIVTSLAEQCSYAELFVGDRVEYVLGESTPGLFDRVRRGNHAVLFGGAPGFVLEVGDLDEEEN